MFLPLTPLLFHGTSIQNLERILRSNRLLAQGTLPQEVTGLLPSPRKSGKLLPTSSKHASQALRVCSFSRSLSSARSHSSRWSKVAGAVLVLNRDAMRERLGHRLFSYNDLYAREGIGRLSMNEAEEAVYGDISRLEPLIAHILVFRERVGPIDKILEDFPLVATHPKLIVLKDFRNTRFDHRADKTYERYMQNGMFRRALAAPALRRSPRFGLRARAAVLFKAMARLN
ncbi:MAG: hypothetical protein ACO24G_07550 [Burkholderiaceae bacterium]|jgi:hypothetical protein